MTISIQAILLTVASSAFFPPNKRPQLEPSFMINLSYLAKTQSLWRCGQVAVPATWFACSFWLRRCWFPSQKVKLVPPSAWQTCDYWAFLWPCLKIKYHIWKTKPQVLWRTCLSPFFKHTSLWSSEVLKWCSAVVKAVFPPCESQLLLQTHLFQLLDYPAVQESAPAGSRRKSKLAMNRSPEWAADAMPSGKKVSDPDSSFTWLSLMWWTEEMNCT